MKNKKLLVPVSDMYKGFDIDTLLSVSKARSDSAKSGFSTEVWVKNKINNGWSLDQDVLAWIGLLYFGKKDMDQNIILYEIKDIKAFQIPSNGKKICNILFEGLTDFDFSHKKADIVIRITNRHNEIINYNISVKKVSGTNDRNHTDRRCLEQWKDLWNIPPDVYLLLEIFLGIRKKENYPHLLKDLKNYPAIRSDRTYMNEFNEKSQEILLNFFRKIETMVISHAVRGMGRLQAEWVLVVVKDDQQNIVGYHLEGIEEALKKLETGVIRITKRTSKSDGNIKVGRVFVKRCGGSKDINKQATKRTFDLNIQMPPRALLTKDDDDNI